MNLAQKIRLACLKASINAYKLTTDAWTGPKDPDPENWRTIQGAKVHLMNGKIDGGAGGKFKGNEWHGKKPHGHNSFFPPKGWKKPEPEPEPPKPEKKWGNPPKGIINKLSGHYKNAPVEVQNDVSEAIKDGTANVGIPDLIKAVVASDLGVMPESDECQLAIEAIKAYKEKKITKLATQNILTVIAKKNSVLTPVLIKHWSDPTSEQWAPNTPPVPKPKKETTSQKKPAKAKSDKKYQDLADKLDTTKSMLVKMDMLEAAGYNPSQQSEIVSEFQNYQAAKSNGKKEKAEQFKKNALDLIKKYDPTEQSTKPQTKQGPEQWYNPSTGYGRMFSTPKADANQYLKNLSAEEIETRKKIYDDAFQKAKKFTDGDLKQQQSDADKWFEPETKKWRSAMTQDEAHSVIQYTGSSYAEMNDSLREGSILNASMKNKIRNLDKALGKTNLTESMYVHRKLTGGSHVLKLIEESKDGIYVENGYSSGSVCKDGDWYGHCSLHIIVPPGKGRGTWIDGAGTYGNKESEFLIPRGAKFRVCGVDTSNKNHKHITVMLIGFEPKSLD